MSWAVALISNHNLFVCVRFLFLIFSGVYLGCCERPFADAAAHGDCKAAGKTGEICPYPDGTFDDCCFDDELAQGADFQSLLVTTNSGAERKHLGIIFFASSLSIWDWLH